ncbi:MAG: universal stress protein [Chloroflexota bacterium]
MGRILCATRGGQASYRNQDAVITLAQERNDHIVFLYVVDTDFLGFTERAVRPDVVATELERMGEFLLAMACERAAKRGVEASYCIRHGKLITALKEAAVEQKATLVALGRPGGDESRFQLASLEKLTAEITEETGVQTRIVPAITDAEGNQP